MLDVLSVTTPIYLLIGLGYLAGRFGLFSLAELRVMGRFVITFALPSLLFMALSQRAVGEMLNGVYLLAYAGGSLIAMLAGIGFARFVRKKPMPLSILYGMGMALPNTGFIGYPIALQVLGPAAAVPVAMGMAVENMLMLPLTLTLLESAAAPSSSLRWHRVMLDTALRLLKNPMIIAIFAGFGVALLGLSLPAVLVRSIDLLAMSSTAVALFVIGGTLVGMKINGPLLSDVTPIALGKLLLHPLAVLTLLWLLPPLEPKLRTAAVLFASMPMLSIYPILAQKYHHERFCAAAVLIGTVLSFVSISAILWALGHFS